MKQVVNDCSTRNQTDEPSDRPINPRPCALERMGCFCVRTAAFDLFRSSYADLWLGDPPGGHHRKGVLRFNAVEPQAREFELRIMRPGESAARVFRWH